MPQEFSHPAESLALTVEEVMDVRRVLVKAEMEQFVPNRELLSSLRKGKVRGRAARRGHDGTLASRGQARALAASSYRCAAAAEPSSRCSPGRRPVSFARGEPSVCTLAAN